MIPEQGVQITVTEESMEPCIQITVVEGDPVEVSVVGPDNSSLFAYHHVQGVSSTVWAIRHGLGWYPNVTTMDSGGSVTHGELTHETKTRLQIEFSAPISGNAYLS